MNESSSPDSLASDQMKAGTRRRLRQLLGPAKGEKVYGFLQFWELVVNGFLNNRCPVRATALAYTTLLALIPMIAIAASISTGILKSQGTAPIQKAIDKLVEQVMPNVDEAPTGGTNSAGSAAAGLATSGSSTNSAVTLTDDQKLKLQELAKTVDRSQIANAIKDSLNRIESGSLGVTGMVGLIVVAIMLFSTIEATFNDIWGVSRGRSWVARVVQYWATVTLGPLIPLLVFSFNIGASLESVDHFMTEYGLGFVMKFFLDTVVPVAILSFGFAFFYQLTSWRYEPLC